MKALLDIITNITNFIWGWPILIALLGGGIIITFRTNFVQLRYLPFI